MIPTIQISLTPESDALIAAARSWPEKLTGNLRKTLDLENELTVGHIVEKRATGAGPFPPEEGRLGVVTSRYRRSVRRSKAVVVGTAIESAIGSNVKYAGAHEFGVNKTVQVKEHRAQHHALDVFDIRGTLTFGWQLGDLGGRGKRKTKVASGVVTVRAHAMQMNIPERAPIRRGIADRATDYRDALSGAVVDTFSASQS